jgi:hypothetical protein
MRLEELELTVRKLRCHIKLHYELFPLLDDAFLVSASTISGGRNRTMEELREVRALCGDAAGAGRLGEKLAELEMAYRILWGGYLPSGGVSTTSGERMVRAVSDKVGCRRNGTWRSRLAASLLLRHPDRGRRSPRVAPPETLRSKWP